MGEKLVAILMLLTLAGCATTPTKYVKPGATEEDFQRALAGCRVQGAMVPAAAGTGAGDELFQTAIMMQTIENCMRAQGFVKQS
jgi:hypothetical protein